MTDMNTANEILSRMQAGEKLRCIPREISGDYSGPPENTADWFLGKDHVPERIYNVICEFEFDETQDEETGIVEWSNPRHRLAKGIA